MSVPVAYFIQFGVIGIPVILFLIARKRVQSTAPRIAVAVAMGALSYGAAYYFAVAHGWRPPSGDGKPSIFGPAATAAFPGFSVLLGCIILCFWKRGTASASQS